MRTHDQYFEPGTKVMRVTYAAALGLLVVSSKTNPPTEKGKVLCVSRSYYDPRRGCNVVEFVGVDLSPPFAAACFRRVSEIQLCVRAAKHVLNPVEQEESQTV